MKVNIAKYRKGQSERKIDVLIENFDSWNLDNTLALIILPALIQLKQTKMGVPNEFAQVGGEDYSDQSSFDFYSETHGESFQEGCKKWDDILDKMIWSFEQLVKDDYEEKYRHGTPEYDWIETDKQYLNPVSGKMETTYQMVDKNPDEHWVDLQGLELHQARIQEGLELFGKYYRYLWD